MQQPVCVGIISSPADAPLRDATEHACAYALVWEIERPPQLWPAAELMFGFSFVVENALKAFL